MSTKKTHTKSGGGGAKSAGSRSLKAPKKNLKLPKKTSATPAQKSPAAFSLPATSDITTVADIHKHTLKISKSHSALTVDAAAVQKITAPCVQVLVAASVAFKGQNFRIQNPSPAVEEAFTLLGLAKQLKEWRL